MRISKLRFPLVGESISRGTSRKWRSGDNFWQDTDSNSSGRINFSRIYIFYAVTFLIVLVFLARLFGLTVVAGEENRSLSENNRIQLVEQEALRGRIFDRNGILLASSSRTFILEKDKKRVEISEAQVKDLEEHGLASENFEGELGRIYEDVKRKYTLLAAGAHVLGYTSAYQAGDNTAVNNQSHTQAVGRLGLEETYNDFLTGKVGKKLIEVDTFGKKVSILGKEDAVDGRDVYITLDSELQKVTYEALKKQAEKVGTKRGAVVVENPQTGEILAFVSTPSFNPEDIGNAVSNPDKPFFNRAMQGTYPPGSIFKIVTALSGLEIGAVNRDSEIEDVGEFSIGQTKFSNWYFNQYGRKEGILKIERAISRSNDIFFYKVAQMVGLENLRKMAIKLGFGQKTGIDLPSEAIGLVPDEVWKKSAYGESWFLGDTMHMGIGQGFMLTTPIQVNSMTSFVASGKLVKLYLVSKIDSGNQVPINLGGKVLAENLVSAQNLNLVKQGMKMACANGGTGWPFFDAPYSVACKTGTAEKTLGNPHAWFTAFAPFENPKIAITVLIEDGGEGSSIAGPVAREVMDWWMGHRAKSN